MSDWEDRYRTSACVHGVEPTSFLERHIHLLPRGRALDLAMGEGRNAIFLARHGYQVLAVDRSPTAVERAQELSAAAGLAVETAIVDLEGGYSIPPNSFDVVAIFYYLQRDLFDAVERALRPGGAVIMETYTVDHARYHAMRPQFMLGRNELLGAFPALRVQVYREIDLVDERKAVASIIARRVGNP